MTLSFDSAGEISLMSESRRFNRYPNSTEDTDGKSCGNYATVSNERTNERMNEREGGLLHALMNRRAAGKGNGGDPRAGVCGE